MDVFIDLRDKIRIQDIAAGYLIVKEAGGFAIRSDNMTILINQTNDNLVDVNLSYPEVNFYLYENSTNVSILNISYSK